MKINMGKADRIIRLIVAMVFGLLFFTGKVTGLLGIILLILGGIFIMTSLIGFCPLYVVLGIRTFFENKYKRH